MQFSSQPTKEIQIIAAILKYINAGTYPSLLRCNNEYLVFNYPEKLYNTVMYPKIVKKRKRGYLEDCK
jgi:hypothetical protein